MISQIDKVLTKSENKKLQKLFLAIYFNDLEKVIEFKKLFPELFAKKDKFLIDKSTNFDLINLTFFNQVIWFNDDWNEEIMPFVKKNQQRTKQMLDFWCAEFGQKIIHKKTEYNQFYEYFYCDDPSDFDEIISKPISKYLKEGFHEIDLKLYNRAQCFDFVEVKKLLKQGAKPDIHFENDDDSSTIRRIVDEISFLSTCQVIPEFESFEKRNYNQNFDIIEMFGDILGLAAHQEMYILLESLN